jgi:pilus assembly protein Flp/PilA
MRVAFRFNEKARLAAYRPDVAAGSEQFPARLVSNLEFVMKSLFARFVKDQSGATAIEYGLIAALISVVCITVLTNVGTKLNTKFASVSGALG